MATVDYGQGGNLVRFGRTVEMANSIAVRSGAQLAAPEVMLITRGSARSPGAIDIEQGASISTLGQGAAAYDSSDGFIYQPETASVVAVSNGRLQWLAPVSTFTNSGEVTAPHSPISVGGCAALACTDRKSVG